MLDEKTFKIYFILIGLKKHSKKIIYINELNIAIFN